MIIVRSIGCNICYHGVASNQLISIGYNICYHGSHSNAEACPTQRHACIAQYMWYKSTTQLQIYYPLS